MNRFLTVIALLAIMTSCARQEELCFNHDEHDRPLVDVIFDWSQHPDANPATMSLFLFPEDGSRSIRYEFANRDGGTIQVPPGRYTAIAINSDFEGMMIRGEESLTDFNIWLRDAYEMQGLSMLSVRSGDVPRAPGAEDERMALAAEPLWRARRDGIVVSATQRSDASIEMTPVDVLSHYTVEITGVENLQGVMALSASISGMAGAMNLHDVSLHPENVTIPFELLATGEDKVSAAFHTLGHCDFSRAPEDDWLHHITVYAVLNDGTQWYHSYDVTDQLHATTERECQISLHGLALPASAGSGSGFSVDIEGWQVVEEVIPM